MSKRILLGVFILLSVFAFGQKNKPKKGPEGPKMEDKPIVPPPTKVTSVEGITEYRLQNGLRVLLFPDPSKQTITVNITYMVGSKHENYGGNRNGSPS